MTDNNNIASQAASTNGHTSSGLGRLGVLVVGLNGAVSTTFVAGVLAVRKGLATPVGSLTQLGELPLAGNNGSRQMVPIRNAVQLADINDLAFGGWDIRDESLLEATKYADVLNDRDIANVAEELDALRPMPGVFDKEYVKKLDGTWVKEGATKYELMEQIREDIRQFKATNNVERVVVIWCASTEVYLEQSQVHETAEAFEEGMRNNDPAIAPSMLYAWAAMLENAPYLNGAPNLTVDFPAIKDLAVANNVPIGGKDFKTGQTMLKTVLAPMLKARMLGLNGWFSSNILGNRDGEVLDDPGSFKTKETSKLSVLDHILDSEAHPELYGDIHHTVRIYYYPPRGDNKEGWDNIDLFGWMGYPMQIKVNFLCRDSILAAPIVLDLILFADLAQRSGMGGVQDWLSFYFKSPMPGAGHTRVEHDLFIQLENLYETLRGIATGQHAAVPVFEAEA